MSLPKIPSPQITPNNSTEGSGAVTTHLVTEVETILNDAVIVPRQKNTNKYYLFGLDGSHITILLQLTIIQRLQDKYPTFLDNITLVSGTQLSAIAVLMISKGYDIATIMKIMKIIIKIYPTRTGLKGAITGVMYNNCYLKTILQIIFKDGRISDIHHLVAIDAFQADSSITNSSDERTHHSLLLTNYKKDFEDATIVDICMRADAVPGYFPPYQGYLSGVLIENNPVSLVFPYFIGQMNIDLDDIVCLSISEGDYEPRYFDMEKYGSGGYLKWGPQLINIFQLSRRVFSEMSGDMYLGEQHCRIDVEVPITINWKDPDALEEFARNVDLSKYYEWIEKKWIMF
ncbi:PNPLA domain-containing protein [Entamoeba marina]